VLLHAGLLQSAVAEPSWNLYEGSSSVQIDYAAGGSDVTPAVNLGLGDSNTFSQFTMDTGSVGILASAQYFQPGNSRS